jgi:DNA-directed RNA polymerase subunit alpha
MQANVPIQKPHSYNSVNKARYREWRGKMVGSEDVSITRLAREGKLGRYAIGPIDAGYASALANALRRVLLSSLEGAAITSVHILGVQHEFQDIPGVLEDVTAIVQSLKHVRLRSFFDRPVTVSLDVQGEGKVFAGAIKGTGLLEIVNPDLHIATLDSEQAHLVMELVVETGRGFVSAEVQAEQKGEQPLGVILIDAIYSPVLHVNCKIERICRRRPENLDQIVLSITTDQTISPDDALRMAADILQQQFLVFVSHEYEKDISEKTKNASDHLIPARTYHTHIEELDLSRRAASMLRRANIQNVGQILEMDDKDLLSIRNCGERTLQELCECLQSKRFLPRGV